jgi:dihydrofolate synthase/folylpolyglutamate synthase
LQWQETLHPAEIELGLGRVRTVAQALGLGLGPDHNRPAGTVITVAGTNGKGSSIAMLESIYRAAGYRTAAYTSPHLQRYNERLRVDGREVGDAELVAAFERVDRARGDTALTYFEFGTLAILDHIQRQAPDLVLLEVGLGGRLDAVNIIDPDLALVTNIGLDHQDWLGDTVEAIGAEKAGIFRANIPAVFAGRVPPDSIVDRARQLGTRFYSPGNGYDYRPSEDGWEFLPAGADPIDLPLPALPGRHQIINAAGVLQVLQLLQARLPVPQDAVRDGLRGVGLAGRMQLVPGPVPVMLDVAHNPDAATALAAGLVDTPVAGRTHAVLAVLADKDIAGITAPLLPIIDHWYCAGLPEAPRGLPVADLAAHLAMVAVDRVSSHPDPVAALKAAMAGAGPGDRVLVFGSFFTVAAVQAGIN